MKKKYEEEFFYIAETIYLAKFRSLIESGVNPNLKHKETGDTALHRACQFARFLNIQYLLRMTSAKPNILNKQGKSPLYIAVLEMPYTDKKYLIVKMLLDSGANPNITHKYGNILHCLLEQNKRERMWRVDMKIIELLISHGIKLNLRNREGKTPFHLATAFYGLPLVKIFVENGADVNMPGRNGKTPLQSAIYSSLYRDGREKICEYLLQKGADANIKDDRGDTAIHIAAKNDMTELIQLMIEYEGDLAIKDNEGRSVVNIICNNEQHEIDTDDDKCYILGGDFSRKERRRALWIYSFFSFYFLGVILESIKDKKSQEWFFIIIIIAWMILTYFIFFRAKKAANT